MCDLVIERNGEGSGDGTQVKENREGEESAFCAGEEKKGSWQGEGRERGNDRKERKEERGNLTLGSV
jgi:hypothetical protein